MMRGGGGGEKVTPLFNDKVLLQCIKDFIPNFNTKDIDFRKPTTEAVVKIYSGLLGYIDLECHGGPDSPEYHSLSHPELYKTVIEYGLIAKSLGYIFESIGSKVQFQLSDLLTPTANNTRVFFSDLCNFLLFAQENCTKLTGGMDLQKNADSRKSMMQQQRDALKNQVTAALAENGMREDKVKDFDKRMSGAENGSQQLASEIAMMQTTESEMERDSNELKERVNFRMEERDSKLGKLKQIENLLVTSPDRVKREVDQIRHTVRSIEQQCIEKEKTVQERKKVRELIKKMYACALEIQDQAKQAVSQEKLKKSLDAELEGMRTENKKMYRDICVLAEELCNINTQISSVNENIASVNYTNKSRMDQIKANLDGYLNEQARLDDLLDATLQRMKEKEFEKTELAQAKLEAEESERSYTENLVQFYEQQIASYDKEIIYHLREALKNNTK